ncbi:protection of telomeres protein 1 isoform X2 [Periophthalmus magnuspinnatus]|uniref:protection of telomeres protein 1 isoform X2 n=1 Tax=Periophthalmus magnuspinnatus TaxID=409849 RepID=UPI0024371214|nr:protection of telomeres protein 1 isoform X2 [Periophthalmus magnuspinnatus]
MPVCVLSQSSQIPAHLTRTSISAIRTGPDWTHACVKGRVVHKDALVPLDDDDFILKAVIQDVDSSPNTTCPEISIKMLLMGSLAKDFSTTVHLGDMVVASGFSVSKSSTVKEKQHPCTLLLSGQGACVYVCSSEVNSVVTRKRSPKAVEVRHLQPEVTSVVTRKKASWTTQAPGEAKEAKYVYSRLDDLEVGTRVNVYGVVVFFKQPFKSSGTDYCSSLKITDQSNQRIGCNIFLSKLEEHPKIFQVGDIIRMHRVKVCRFNDSVSLINTFGFSAVTFDGSKGEPVEPRTSCQTIHFDEEDQRMVEQLRAWSFNQALLPTAPSVTLSTVQPSAYFDLSCQLLAKAPLDSSCTLLRVWDGTKCPHPLLKVLVDPEMTEGPSSFSPEQENLIANVLVYDNHVEVAEQLKPGDFLRIYNVRAVLGSSKVPGLAGTQTLEQDHLAFHLHRGTAYGRGIRVLPQTSPTVQELKSVIEAFMQNEDDHAMMEVWGTPPESVDTDPVSTDSITETNCRHSIDPLTLSEVKRSNPGQVHHVKVQVKSYQPQKLHQSLKLFCDKCSTMQDVPDEDHVLGLLSAASQDRGPCSAPVWALSGQVQLPVGPAGPSDLSLYFSPQLMFDGKNKQLVFLKGANLAQVKTLSASYLNIVPVRSSGGQLALLDLSAPVLFRGRRRYYGCKKCSNPAVREPSVEGVDVVSEKLVAEALGVELLRYVLLLRLELQDSSGSLDVLLWRDAELFFNVSAADAASSQKVQDHICQTMGSLCPPEGSTVWRPWLDMCLVSYEAQNDEGINQTVYQICHTKLSKATPEPDPVTSP